MIIPDVNLLLYASNKDSAFYERSREWLVSAFEGQEAVGLPWVVLLG